MKTALGLLDLHSIVKRQLSIVLILISLLLLVTCYLLLTPNVHAQSACADPGTNLSAKEAVDQINRCAIEEDIFDDKIFNLNQIAGTSDSLYTMLFGKSQLHPETNAATQGGALAASGKFVASLYANPPASGVEYFASKVRDFNPVKPAYAQTGVGYQALSPVANIWRSFRNASYVGFVIVFVIIGFMIMFRARISPQAVATVQDSIPRIIVALALVTFSYAIAGFMLDLMFLIINLAITILSPPITQPGLTDQAQNVFTQSILGIITGSWGDIVGNTADALNNAIQSVFQEELPGFIGDIAGFFGGWLGGIVVGLAVLFVMFRVFLMLLTAFVMIIILTIAAPFFFLIQALPGNTGASAWFRQMASNVAVFPAVAVMLLFAGLIGGIGHLGGGGNSALEGQIGSFPLLTGGLDSGAIGGLIAIGFILITPEAANLVKGAFAGRGGGGGFGGAALGGAIGGALGAGAAPVGAFARGAAGAAVTRGPIGGWRAAQQSRRQEEATIRGRAQVYTRAVKERGGVSQEDVERFGLGYPQRKK